MGRLKAAYPGIRYRAVKANTSAGKDEVGMTSPLTNDLHVTNADDLQILESFLPLSPAA